MTDITEILDALEDMARQHCYTDSDTHETNSHAFSTNADVLRLLARHGRFKIVREFGRVVVGYWPENDPREAALRKLNGLSDQRGMACAWGAESAGFAQSVPESPTPHS